jgi:hypothetical protein
MFATADGRSNRIAEYENKIHRLESMLQVHNAAQPDMEQQPLQPADTSVPAAEWVTNLRNHLPTLHRPDLVNFEELYTDSEWHDGRWLPNDGQNGKSVFPSALQTNSSTQNIATSLSLDDFEPSADFQEDTAFLQSADCAPDFAIEEDALLPPPLPDTPVCDW